jgi:hypothetical protein
MTNSVTKIHSNLKTAKNVREFRDNMLVIMNDFYNGKLTLHEARVLTRMGYVILKSVDLEHRQSKMLNITIPVKFLSPK